MVGQCGIFWLAWLQLAATHRAAGGRPDHATFSIQAVHQGIGNGFALNL